MWERPPRQKSPFLKGAGAQRRGIYVPPPLEGRWPQRPCRSPLNGRRPTRAKTSPFSKGGARSAGGFRAASLGGALASATMPPPLKVGSASAFPQMWPRVQPRNSPGGSLASATVPPPLDGRSPHGRFTRTHGAGSTNYTNDTKETVSRKRTQRPQSISLRTCSPVPRDELAAAPCAANAQLRCT